MDIRPWPELQELLPPLSQYEREHLKNSIAQDGVRIDILVMEDGRIIEGHHRWTICQELGVNAPYKIEYCTERDGFVLGVVLNLMRRQLSLEQEKEIQDRLRSPDIGLTQAQVARVLGKTQGAISQNESGHNISSNNMSTQPCDSRVKIPPSEHDNIYDRCQAGEPHTTIAADYHVSTKTVQRIKTRVQKRLDKENAPPAEPSDKSPILIVGHAEHIPQIANNTVDIIITSPPYNMGASNWPMGGSDTRRARDDGIGYTDDLDEQVYQQWQIDCLIEMYRVAKDGASFFYNHKVRNREGTIIHPMDWLRSEHNPWTIRQEIIWDRGSTHNHSPTLFWPHDERIYWMTKGKPTLPDHPVSTKEKPSIWKFHGPEANTWHPAPFPDTLPRLCLEAIGKPGDTILDPFCGSCTTLKVALELGYDAIGVDASKEYMERACKENGWTLLNKG